LLVATRTFLIPQSSTVAYTMLRNSMR
jgi:hypothetical protein